MSITEYCFLRKMVKNTHFQTLKDHISKYKKKLRNLRHPFLVCYIESGPTTFQCCMSIECFKITILGKKLVFCENTFF